MDVTALCTRLLISVLMVLVVQGQNTCAHKDGAAFLHIFPNRLQFFEYEVINFKCTFDGSTGWRLMRTLQEIPTNSNSTWLTSEGSKVITPAFSSDSGEYWCEDGDGQRTNSINITVTTGSVILESPALPVKEGDDVTLQCKKKKSAASLPADFYKDGIGFKTGYKANRTIHSVSTSDEGRYKCFIGGAGESPESRLVVEGSKHHDVSGPPLVTTKSREETDTVQRTLASYLRSPLGIAVSALLLVLLLLVIAVVRCRKHKSTEDKTEGANYTGVERHNDPHDVTYAVVQKKPRERATCPDEIIDPYYTTFADVGIRTDKIKEMAETQNFAVGGDSLIDPYASSIHPYASVNRKEKVAGGDSLIDPYSYAYASVNRKEKVVGGDSLNDPYSYAYASVKRKEKGGDSLMDPCTVTYASVKWKEKGPKKSAVGARSCQPEDNPVYSLVVNHTHGATESRNT